MEKAPDSTKSALSAITEKYGFPAKAIVSMADVIDALYPNIITEKIKDEIDAYYKEWGALN